VISRFLGFYYAKNHIVYYQVFLGYKKMADEETEKEPEIDEDNTDGDIVPEKGMKKKLLIYVILAIVVIGAGVGGIVAYFTSVNKEAPQPYDVVTRKNADGSGETSTIYYSLPELSANLRTSAGIYETVRIQIGLELSSVDDIATITSMNSKINDIIIGHLVEITPEEISGSEGFYALKIELLHRINLMISPIKVLNLNIKYLDVKITDALEKQED